MIYKDTKAPRSKGTELKSPTIDPEEISRFNKLAEEWWKTNGAFKVVHAFNAARIEKLSRTLPTLLGRECGGQDPLSGLSLLDVGCGAGIVSEPMARLGAEVTAIDASDRNISVAKHHAKKSGVDINYQHALAEEIGSKDQIFDIVMSLEVLEHVADPVLFLNNLSSLVKPGGVLAVGTINRTPLSYIKAIIGAEYILGWLPRGTHDWRKFVQPHELNEVLLPLGYSFEEGCGIDFNLLNQRWVTSKKQHSIYLNFYKRSSF